MSDSGDGTGDDVDVDRWRTELEEKRAEKDEFFGTHPQSPIPPDDRDAFDGLSYFEPDPTYRVTATVETHDDPEVVLMETTAGGEMRYLRVRTLEFTLDREEPDLADGMFELAAYRLESSGDQPLSSLP